MLRDLVPVVIAGLVPFAVLTLIVVGTAVNLVAWQPPIIQTTQFGTANSSNGVVAIAYGPTGVYATGVVGYYNMTPSYLFVSKYDSNVRQIWTEHFSNATDFSNVSGIALGGDGVFVVGTLDVSANASFVRKYDLSGNLVWNVQFGNVSTAATAVSAAATSVYVAGYGGYNSAYFLRSYNLDGTLVWSRLLGNYTGSISLYSSSSGVYASYGESEFTGLVQSYDPNGTLVWSREYSCRSNGMTGDSSGLYVVGQIPTLAGVTDGFLAKYSLNGNQLWTTTFKAPGFSAIGNVEVSVDSSGIYLASITSSERGIVTKYDQNGNLQWSIQLPWITGTGDLTPGDAIAVGSGGIYLGGDSGTRQVDAAFIALMGESSSLVFFGVNPPLSFAFVGLLAAAVIVSVLSLRRQRKKRFRQPTASARYSSQKTPIRVGRI